jgi:hypothetical protein
MLDLIRFSRSGPSVSLMVILIAGVMVRADSAPTTAPADQENPVSAVYSEYKWSNGDKPVKMIRKEEGFCFLTEVGGHFAGGGEVVHVYIGPDGFWYLGGNSGQPELWGKAMSVRFVHPIKASVVLPEDPDIAAWPGELAKLAASDDPAAKDLAVRERAEGLPPDSAGLFARAGEWDQATIHAPPEERRLIDSHIIRICAMSVAGLTGPQRDAAVGRANALRISLANRQLNDLGEWTNRLGDWSVKDRVIQGRGDSKLEFKRLLPANCFIEWRMKVVDGMRPRVLLLGTDAFIGNEGFDRVIDAYGLRDYRGISTPYANGSDLKIGVKCVGSSLELYVNDELMAKGKRPAVPGEMGIVVRGGDDWSAGVTQFWDFKISAVQ